jgi:hypothetical protein
VDSVAVNGAPAMQITAPKPVRDTVRDMAELMSSPGQVTYRIPDLALRLEAALVERQVFLRALQCADDGHLRATGTEATEATEAAKAPAGTGGGERAVVLGCLGDLDQEVVRLLADFAVLLPPGEHAQHASPAK